MDSDSFGYFEPSDSLDTISVIEQYASDVRSFSSQYGSEISISYTAYNITGKPSKYPAYGDFPQTFVMRTYGKWWDEAPSKRIRIKPLNESAIKSQDYIDIIFERKVIPLTVNIYETYHPGSVVRIWATDGNEKWSILWEGNPQIRDHSAHIYTPAIKKIDYYTNLLRLEFDHSHLDYYTEIDAVSLTGIPELSYDQMCISVSENVKFIYKKTTNGENTSSTDSLEYLDGSLAILEDTVESSNEGSNDNYEADDGPFCALPPYWYKVNANALKTLSQKCQHLQRLELSWCGSFPCSISPQIFCRFIRNCGKMLTHVRLDCCQFVCNCCMETISQVCKNLKELTLQNCMGVSDRGFRHLAKLNGIERLDFYRTIIETPALQEILIASPNLKHINLGSCRAISSMDAIAQTLGNHNKALVSVDFWKTYSLTPIGIKFLSQCSLLEEIDIGWCLGVSIPGDCFLLLAMGCPRLRKLFMGTLRGINDNDLYPFIYNCPDLEQIDLLGNRGITSDVCINILKSCKKLKFLDVSFCEQINDIDVHEWKLSFPNVDIKRSFQSEPECTCAFTNHY